MSIKKFIANKDTTITNAYEYDLKTRAVDANMGAADSLEIFSIVGQTSTSSLEKSRILVEFPINEILEERSLSKIPNSGSVKFFLRLFNVGHGASLPKDFHATINPISRSWDEGYGLDMESYTDKGWYIIPTNGSGCTWIRPTSGSNWDNQGGDILTGSGYNFSYYFKNGYEDIELDVTNIVEQWAAGTIQNNGFLIKLSGSFEDGSTKQSFYTKKFSARGSQYFYKRPALEARWESVTNDDRINFFCSSSMYSPEDNKMNIYFFNKVNGRLKNIYGNIIPDIKLYTNSNFSQEITASYKTISNPLEGVYKATIALNTTASVVYDKWYNTSSLDNYFSSSFDVYKRENFDFNFDKEYVINISNIKNVYSSDELAKFKIFVREKNWQPNIYTVATNNIENTTINDLYYKIFRLNDNYTIINYSTGSLAYSKTSYDSSGNYFDLDMKIFEPNYNYGIKLARWNGINLEEYPTTFKFKVE